MDPILWTAAALAQALPDDTPLDALTLRFDTRYDTIAWGEEANRLQNSALVGFTVDTVLDVDLVGMASTGDDFTSRWSTWWDFTGEPLDQMALHLRQLYLQRWFGPVRIQAGSLPPVKGDVSTSGLEDLGWIDGVRAEVHTEPGLIVEAVGGSLADLDEPDLFLRERQPDYAEVELTQALPRDLEAELAFHHLAPDSYLKVEVGWAPEDPIELRAELSVNVVNATTLAVLLGEADLLALPTGRFEDRLVSTVRLRWVHPDYGLFGALSEDFYQYGAECTFRFDGAIDREGYLSWTARAIAPLQPTLDPRLSLGLTAKLRLSRR